MHDNKEQILASLESWLSHNFAIVNYESVDEWKVAVENVADKSDLSIIDKFMSYASDADNPFNNMMYSIQELNDCYDDLVEKASSVCTSMLENAYDFDSED